MSDSNLKFLLDIKPVDFSEDELLQLVNTPYTATPEDIDKYLSTDYPAAPKAPVCECGAEKCGDSNHSKWCPKFEEEA